MKMNSVSLIALCVLTTSSVAFGQQTTASPKAPTQIHCEVEEAQQGDGQTQPLLYYKTVLTDDIAIQPMPNLPAGFPALLWANEYKKFTVDNTSYDLLVDAQINPGNSKEPSSESLSVIVSYTSASTAPIPAMANLMVAGNGSIEGFSPSFRVKAGNNGSPVVVWDHGLAATCTLK